MIDSHEQFDYNIMCLKQNNDVSLSQLERTTNRFAIRVSLALLSGASLMSEAVGAMMLIGVRALCGAQGITRTSLQESFDSRSGRASGS